jgi:beta-phosphoglucomutase-like phosphatase (HAD superfamily)
LATNSTSRQAFAALNDNQKIQLKGNLAAMFDLVKTRDDMNGVKKPNPAIYLKVAEELGVDISECLVIEDSYEGVLAAKSAGMVVIAIYDEDSDRHRKEIEALSDYNSPGFNNILGKLEKNHGELARV